MAGWQAQLETDAADVLGRPLAERERAQFEKYMELLLKWQRVHRLLGSAEPAWIVANVFVDSLFFWLAMPPGAACVLDFGSGAGVPGVPLAIVAPDLRLHFLESRQKRVSFLSDVVRTLRLTNCRVLAARAEGIVDSLGARFDAVVMRCAGPTDATFPLALRLVRPGGSVIASTPRQLASSAARLEIRSASGRMTRTFKVATQPISG